MEGINTFILDASVLSVNKDDGVVVVKSIDGLSMYPVMVRTHRRARNARLQAEARRYCADNRQDRRQREAGRRAVVPDGGPFSDTYQGVGDAQLGAVAGMERGAGAFQHQGS